MLPTFNATGDILFTEFITPRLRRLRAGDVVVATKPTDHRVSIVKRVRGMPGDTIWVHPFGQPQPVKIRVPLDHVWLEGDNHHQSTDSREYGPVPLVLVRGKVWFRFWPLSQAKWVESRVVDHTEGLRILTSSPSFIPAPSKNHSMCDVVHHASQGVSAAEED